MLFFYFSPDNVPALKGSTTPRPVSCFSDDFALGFHGICGGVDEFFSGGEHSMGDAVKYKLHTLSKLDDFEHYHQRVADQFAFHLYDVVNCEGGCNRFKRFGDLQKPYKRSKDFQLWSLSKTVDCCSDFQMSCNVRAVSACRHVDIILDSGSDVTLIPMFMSDVGCQAPQNSETYLRERRRRRDTGGTRQSVHPTPWQCTLSHACHAKVAETKGHRRDTGKTPGRTSDPLAVHIE